MAIQKKSLIGNMNATKKAIVATNVASTPLQPVQGQPGLPTLKKHHGLPTLKKHHGLPTLKKNKGLPTLKRFEGLATLKKK